MEIFLTRKEKRELKAMAIGSGIASIMLLATFIWSLSLRPPKFISPLGSGIPMAYASVLDSSITTASVPEATPSMQELVEAEIKDVFGEKAEEALKVARCESKLGLYKCNDGLNSNGSVDCGIFQVNSIHGVSRKWLNNYKINILIAKQLYDEQGGWGAWYSSKSCHNLN